jgi:hypothetical protein
MTANKYLSWNVTFLFRIGPVSIVQINVTDNVKLQYGGKVVAGTAHALCLL